MILLDANAVIYFHQPAWRDTFAKRLQDEVLLTCNVVIAEVLGFKDLKPHEIQAFETLFGGMSNYPFDDDVLKLVIHLRRHVKIQLPDAIIAATALANNAVLWSHNTRDFSKVPDLLLHDPLV